MIYDHPTLNAAAHAIQYLPKPRNDAELRVLTLLCFGRESGLEDLSASYGGSYRSDTKFGDMFSKEFYKHHNTSSYCVDLYSYAGRFWNHVIGPLTCGGIGVSSYGQIKILGHRHKRRLEAWEKSRRENQDRSLRTPFVGLARQLRDGKNREIRGIPVLISGREDGADTASSTLPQDQAE